MSISDIDFREGVYRQVYEGAYAVARAQQPDVAAHAAFGMLEGAERPALAVIVPTRNSPAVLLDVGATVDVAQVDAQAQGLDEASAGRRLFELVAACRDAGIDPDSALRRHTAAVVRTAEANAAHG